MIRYVCPTNLLPISAVLIEDVRSRARWLTMERYLFCAVALLSFRAACGFAQEGQPHMLASPQINAARLSSSSTGLATLAEPRVKIEVEVIRAEEPFPAEDLEALVTIPRGIDARLRALTPKLERLHFRQYKYVTSFSRTLDLLRRENLALVDGTTLSLRPTYIQGNRIGMWLHWQDRAGAALLDTRMHFDCGENMLTGVDSEGGGGLILAITAHLVPPRD